MNEPDFTIITPSYNYGHYIGECLQSVANQKGASFEHLVMDAGSSDDTIAVVSEHPHATWYQEPDKGMSDGINKGFKRAKGEWVMWLNADDRLLPGALSAVKNFASRNPGADVIYGCWNFMNNHGEHIRRMTVFPLVRSMLSNHGCYIASTSTFFRRKTTIAENHLLNEEFQYVMDGEYFCRLAYERKRFEYLPVVLADFRLHDQSLSQKHINKTDVRGTLDFQKQVAESRTIRRVYGIKLFKDEMLNSIVDGFLFHGYRVLKGILKLAYRHKTLMPFQLDPSVDQNQLHSDC